MDRAQERKGIKFAQREPFNTAQWIREIIRVMNARRERASSKNMRKLPSPFPMKITRAALSLRRHKSEKFDMRGFFFSFLEKHVPTEFRGDRSKWTSLNGGKYVCVG